MRQPAHCRALLVYGEPLKRLPHRHVRSDFGLQQHATMAVHFLTEVPGHCANGHQPREGVTKRLRIVELSVHRLFVGEQIQFQPAKYSMSLSN